MKHKPALTDEEIRSHMDFDKLLQMNNDIVAKARIKNIWIKAAGYSTLTVSIVGLITYYSNNNRIENTIRENPSLVDPKTETIQPVLIDSLDSSNQQSISKIKDEPVTKSEKAERSIKPEIKPEATTIQKADTIRKKSLVKFTEAQPIEGYPALYQYFNTELRYPIEMAKDSIEGTVVVSFIIDVRGTPGDIKIMNSLGQAFDKESIRIIENMPKWKAATVDGEPTPTRLSIPLTFKILK